MDKYAEILVKSSKAIHAKATSTASCYQLNVFPLWHFDREQLFGARKSLEVMGPETALENLGFSL